MWEWTSSRRAGGGNTAAHCWRQLYGPRTDAEQGAAIGSVGSKRGCAGHSRHGRSKGSADGNTRSRTRRFSIV